MPPRPRTFAWEWWFDAPPPRVWPLVSDTDRLDRDAGLPPATYTHRAIPGDDLALSVRQTFYGVMPMRYVEDPYEWVEGERYAVERRFEKGPVTRFRYGVRLEPDARGTRVVAEMTVDPRSTVSSWLVPMMARGAKKGLDRAFARVEQELGGLAPDVRSRMSVRRKALERLARAGASIPEAVGARLAAHLAGAEASDLRRIRPFALADRWKLARRDVLDAFLHAVRAGVLELTWESLCPHCRGSDRSVKSLAAMRSSNRCDACGIDFDVEFDRSIEAVFRPAADLRTIGREVFCLGGPGNTPHIAAQAAVAAGGDAVLRVTLDEGAFRLRGARREGAAVIHVEDDQTLPTRATVDLGDRGVRATPHALARGRVELAIRNTSPANAVLVVERTRWLDDVATALDVVSMEGFRDLSTEASLAPGERIAVRRIAILFTDLRGSTGIYRRMGDAAAYALVREHFEVLRGEIRRHNGMLVKTIGDAVMASFRTPADAVASAIDDAPRDRGARRAGGARAQVGRPCRAVDRRRRERMARLLRHDVQPRGPRAAREPGRRPGRDRRRRRRRGCRQTARRDAAHGRTVPGPAEGLRGRGRAASPHARLTARPGPRGNPRCPTSPPRSAGSCPCPSSSSAPRRGSRPARNRPRCGRRPRRRKRISRRCSRGSARSTTSPRSAPCGSTTTS